MTRPTIIAICFALCAGQLARTQEIDVTSAAQSFRKNGEAVQPSTETTIICEAEEFQIDPPAKGGWQAKLFGANYYAATFANAFLSRRAFLGAPEQCENSTASITVQVPKAGRYLVLSRYEACYRFETQFRVKVEQNGAAKLDRLYGARDNLKIWAFREGLKKEVAWPWGAGENVVWEGHDAYADLQPGTAKITLIAGKQPELAAQRNVDLIMLTSDEEQIKNRLAKENYLPLDGMLTQAGDVHVKVQNKGGTPLTVVFPAGTEHSPYWVHMRNWKPVSVTVPPGQKSDWVEVGSVLDTLSHGQWNVAVQAKDASNYALEFGASDARGKITPTNTIDNLTGNMQLAYDANTRYSRRVRLSDDVLYDLLDYLRKHPVKGVAPKRTLIYGYTFTRKPNDAKYNAAIDEFIRLIGATALGRDTNEDVNDSGAVRGYIDVRGVPTPKLEEYCQNLKKEGRADKIAVVSMGDEIGLPAPPAKDHAAFRAWLKSQNVSPKDLGGADIDTVEFSPTEATAKANPALYYYSKIYGFRYGIKALKDRTDILRRNLPNAGIGANFSPHHGHMYLGETHHWISIFREDGMTMPWGEDYIFQVPVGSQQMNSIMVDMFRAGIRTKPNGKIHYYVMAHAPNNTPNSWRRQFYGDVGHGVQVFNLFEFRPMQVAYTENHVNSPEMYQAVREGFHELGQFEDIVQDGRVRPGVAALWFSEAGDVWHNNKSPFDAGKRTLYIAIRQQQLPLDMIVDGDDLKSYKVLYLADANVSQAGSKAIAEWVKAGGQLVVTAGAGMFDELNRPNTILRELLGVEQTELVQAPGTPIVFSKQDLPFAEGIDEATCKALTVQDGREGDEVKIPVYGLRSKLQAKTAKVEGKFRDGSPAVTVNQVGKGRATCIAFLPGLSYFKPAIPKRPMDRGATDDHMTHFVPTEFDAHAGQLIRHAAGSKLELPVVCSNNLVESTVVQSKAGTLIPLINWTPRPIKGLQVSLNVPGLGQNITLASGRSVSVSRETGVTVATLDLDVADALIIR